MKLSDLRNKGVPFVRLREVQNLVFFYCPRIGVEEFWVYRIPSVIEVVDEKTHQKKKIVRNRRYISPGQKASYFGAFRRWLRDNEQSIPDDMVIWDLHDNIPDAMTRFTKSYVLGKNQDDWRQNFQIQQEVYAGIVDHKDSAVKILGISGGVWFKWKKEMTYQISRLGNMGDPDKTIIAYCGTYDGTVKNSQERYAIRQEDRIQATDAVKSQLENGPTPDIMKLVARDHFEDVKTLVLAHLNPVILEKCKADKVFDDLDPNARQYAGFGGDGSFNTEEMGSQNAADSEAPVAPPSVVPAAPVVPPSVVPAAPVVPPSVVPAAPVAPPSVVPAAPVAPPSVAPAAEAQTKKPSVIVPCLSCKQNMDLSEGGTCPHCKTKIF